VAVLPPEMVETAVTPSPAPL